MVLTLGKALLLCEVMVLAVGNHNDLLAYHTIGSDNSGMTIDDTRNVAVMARRLIGALLLFLRPRPVCA
jgi:hypothetical protein